MVVGDLGGKDSGISSMKLVRGGGGWDGYWGESGGDGVGLGEGREEREDFFENNSLFLGGRGGVSSWVGS